MLPNRVVILEGPDGTGKTTLARWLEAQHGFEYFHEGPPPKGQDLLIYYGTQLFQALKHDRPVVFDRLHIGEEVYGPILRGSKGFSVEEFRLMDRMIRAAGVTLVFARAPYHVAEANWRNRPGELFRSLDQFNQVWGRWEQLYDLFPYAGSWDYTQMGYVDAANWLAKIRINKRALPVGMIGSPTAAFLFVGDQANQVELDVPFFSMQGCSPFLNDCLRAAAYSEQEIALCNAWTLDGKLQDYMADLPDMPFKRIIALGGNASKGLAQVNASYTAVAHPQYWKRFQQQAQEQYVIELARIRKEAYAVPARN